MRYVQINRDENSNLRSRQKYKHRIDYTVPIVSDRKQKHQSRSYFKRVLIEYKEIRPRVLKQFKWGGKMVRSLKGNPPHNDTGKLRKSIRLNQSDEGITIRSGRGDGFLFKKPYAEILENDNPNNKWYRPNLRTLIPKSRILIRNKVRKILNKKTNITKENQMINQVTDKIKVKID